VAFLSWLESTAYVRWMLDSLVAYPFMLTVHALGLALTVGVLLALDLRLLGLYRTIPLTSLDRLLGIAWVGIALNAFTGVSIFMTEATRYVTNVPFILKMLFVVLGAVSLAAMQRLLRRNASTLEAGQVPPGGRGLAVSSVLFWTMAVVTGRLIAYL
jgi:uncharacterized protein DUF6644